MENWCMVTFAFADCGTRGKGQTFQDAFAMVFTSRGGPADAAMFTNHDENFEHCFYYLSPGAMRIARNLIEGYRPVACNAPIKGTVALAVGEAGACETLLPASNGS